jgi:hypothetical protein
MIFYRSPASKTGGPSGATLRLLTSLALVAYPIGGAILAASSGSQGGLFSLKLFGLGLLLLAVLAAAPVLGSRLQRIVGDNLGELDEMERQLRFKALSWGYSAFTALALLTIVYVGIATDTGLWLPRSFDAWNAVFWGAFLYASLLPTAFLAWTLKDPDREA